jgi:hypothetical protein
VPTDELTILSGAEVVADMMLLRLHGYADGEPSDDEESREYEAEVERLNPDWQPGQIPKVPAGYADGRWLRDPALTPPEVIAWREEKIREHGEWAYWQEGELKGHPKADWLLAKGPERDAADMARVRRTMLANRARLAQLRRDGYWFDEEHRLQAPVAAAPTGRVQVAARAPRRNVRRARARARAPGSKDPPESDLAVIPPSRFWRDVRRWQEAA